MNEITARLKIRLVDNFTPQQINLKKSSETNYDVTQRLISNGRKSV
jgi:hypothetical protein